MAIRSSASNRFTSKSNEYRWRVFKRGRLVLNGCMMLAFSFAVSAVMPQAAQAADAVAAGALPIGAITVDGSASHTYDLPNHTLDIDMSTSLVRDSWARFNIGRDATVNIGGGSTYIGSVRTGGGVSHIYGQLNAPGVDVYLRNSSGITFYGSAGVNVGSLLATTANGLSIDGTNIQLTSTGGEVRNEGTITVSNGGFAILTAPNVENAGTINATISVLASADSFGIDTVTGAYSLSNGGAGAAVNSGTINGGADGIAVVVGSDATNSGTINSRDAFVVAADAAQLELDTPENGDVLTVSHSGEGTATNSGTINVGEGGTAAVIGPVAVNSGTINADKGTIHLASATAATVVDLRGDNLINFEVTETTLNKLGVTNTGTLRARSGVVSISSKAASTIAESVVNLGGVVDADAFGVDDNGGTVLVSSVGDVNTNGATITAAGGANGGSVSVDAQKTVNLADTSVDVSGGIGGAGGTVTIAADTHLVGEDVSINAKGGIGGAGGSVSLSAVGPSSIDLVNVGINASGGIGADGGDVTISSTGTVSMLGVGINANGGIGGNGGSVEIHSDNNVNATGVRISADGRGIEGNGGTVDVTANNNINFGNVDITADAGIEGDSGRISLVAGGTNLFGAKASASVRGGAVGGNGGLIEITGEDIRFRGDVDVSAPFGDAGTLHLTSSELIIRDGSASEADDLNVVYEEKFEGIADQQANIILTARDGITVEDLADNELQGANGNLTFEASVPAGGFIRFEDKNDGVTTGEGDITMTAGAGGIDIGYLTTGGEGVANPGAIYLKTELSELADETGGDIDTTNLTVIGNSAQNSVNSITGSVVVDAVGHVTLDGDLRIEIAILAGSTATATAEAYIDAGGDVTINGNTNVVANASAGSEREGGNAYATYLGHAGQDYTVNGDITVSSEADSDRRSDARTLFALTVGGAPIQLFVEGVPTEVADIVQQIRNSDPKDVNDFIDLVDVGALIADAAVPLPEGDGTNTGSVTINGGITLTANADATRPVEENPEENNELQVERPLPSSAYASAVGFLGAPHNVSVDDVTVDATAFADETPFIRDGNIAIAAFVIHAGQDTGVDASTLSEADGGNAHIDGDIVINADTNTETAGKALAVGVVSAESDIIFNDTVNAPIVTANDSFLQQLISGDNIGDFSGSHLRLTEGEESPVILPPEPQVDPIDEIPEEIVSVDGDPDVYNVNDVNGNNDLNEDESSGANLLTGLEPAAGGDDECDYMNCEQPG